MPEKQYQNRTKFLMAWLFRTKKASIRCFSALPKRANFLPRAASRLGLFGASWRGSCRASALGSV